MEIGERGYSVHLLPLPRQFHKPSGRDDPKGISIEIGDAFEKSGPSFHSVGEPWPRKGSCLPAPCAHRGAKGAGERCQSEGAGCPADEPSSLSPCPHLKEIQITNTHKAPSFSFLPFSPSPEVVCISKA